jgi:hypothetical protein
MIDDQNNPCCKVLIPPQSLQMSPDEEENMVQYAINRSNYWRQEMGWTPGSGMSFERESWLWKRHVATRMYEGDFSHRMIPGNIFARVNLTLNMVLQFIEQHKSRMCDDLLGSEKFFGVVPEGPEDQHPVLQDVEHVLHDSSMRLGLQDKFKRAVLNAMIRGEAVPKLTRKVERKVEQRKVRLVMSEGMPARDSRGGLITSLDRWEVLPENPAMKFMVRDPRVMMSAAVPPLLGPEVEMPVTVAQTTGCDFAFPHWSDLIIPPLAQSLDSAELLGHCFMMAVPDLFDTLPEMITQTSQGKAYLDEVKGSGATDNPTEQQKAVAARGEKNDATQDEHERAFRQRRYTELYFRYDVRGNGRYEHMAMLIDHEAQWPIYYGLASEILTWTDRHHPFEEPFRINPLEDRWYGRGYYEQYGDKSLFVDKCWCRIELELQRSGNLLIENRQASLNGQAGKPIMFRTTETIQTSGQARPEDVISVVKVQAQVVEIEKSMETMLQKMQSEAGVTSPGDAVSTGMDAANTLGGMQILEQQKSTNLREREAELLSGMNAALKGVAQIEFHGELELQKIAKLLDSKKMPGQPLPQIMAPQKGAGVPGSGFPVPGGQEGPPPAGPEQGPPPPPSPAEMEAMLTGMDRAKRLQMWAIQNSKALCNVIKIFVTRSRQAKLYEQCTKIIQVIDKWLSYPPQVRPNLYDTYADMLRALDVANPDVLLGPKNPPMLPAGPPVMAGAPAELNQAA